MNATRFPTPDAGLRLSVRRDDTADLVRDAARQWLKENVPADWLAAGAAGDRELLRRIRPVEVYESWYPTLAASGMVAPQWDLDYGGLGLGSDHARVIDEELKRVALIRLNLVGVGLAGPTILRWGTEEQRRRFLWPLVSNAEPWCQLFSEPGAGSDLSGLATRAEEQDDGTFVVRGQKVWSSFAHLAQRGMLLARTNPDAPKHRGITWFALDMSTAGVEVRPLVQFTGDAEFNEVFLDDVRVSDDDRIGPRDGGWEVARTTLMNERVVISGGGVGFGDRTGGRSVERIIELARRRPDARTPAASDDPRWRQRLAQLWIESRLIRWNNLRARAAGAATREPGAEGSIGKLFQAEHNQRLQSAAIELLGPLGTASTPGDPVAESVRHGFLRSRANTIEGGTSEIQRNILGERILRLPKEPSLDRNLPWCDLPRSGDPRPAPARDINR